MYSAGSLMRFSVRSGRHLTPSLSLLHPSGKHQSCPQGLQMQARNFSYSEAVSKLWMSLSSSTPVSYCQEGLIKLHDSTGLPWWGTIILSTILLRSVVTVPLTIYQQKIMARLELITLELPEIAKELKMETAIAMKKFNWTEKEAQIMFKHSLKKQWSKLVVRENCHPAKTMIVLWGQIPLWIFQSVAIRNLVYMLPDPKSLYAGIIFAQLSLGGFLWIPNLTIPDASLILPISLGIINLAIVEIQVLSRVRPGGRLHKIGTNFMRVISVIMIPVACTVPSCLSLYWVTSSAFGLAQNFTMMSPKFRRALGIPVTPSQLEHPYKHLADGVSQRAQKMLSWLPKRG
ncbi:cytochrome c oxidase assembly protein COX18, mitochondrial [Phlebotomus argentipes]|uniref:cytochrome c oxidase assembly protein COX18, mitochondrial n=1 Tax=Phlebotomus argentipes TaxID=94469 RepID=UPI002892ABAA|nr:cytochrome c oxidase assembly protein COX18, mitochondrial [Phlebotomus argentipes]XP_059615693.1 cytochrome c oxidase assembly protein COX18, mitochondrial [Phlebotomus argentipes]XP_059615694.1 cytochrome c oxidase assembly protein COX18, mitochondrial [Phlebotomus argentipes]